MHKTVLIITIDFRHWPATLSHFHSLQVENCESNSRLVVGENDNGKFRLERVIKSLFEQNVCLNIQIFKCLISNYTSMSNFTRLKLWVAVASQNFKWGENVFLTARVWTLVVRM